MNSFDCYHSGIQFITICVVSKVLSNNYLTIYSSDKSYVE